MQAIPYTNRLGKIGIEHVNSLESKVKNEYGEGDFWLVENKSTWNLNQETTS